MRHEWVILHGGALGDLILTLQTALAISGLRDSGDVFVVSRVNPTPLAAPPLSLSWRSPDVLQTHWLFREDDESRPPPLLHELVANRNVLNCLDGPDSRIHARLASLGPRGVFSIDPRPIAGDRRHITDQWRAKLFDQGVRFTADGWGGLPARPCGQDARTTPRVLIHPGGGGERKLWPLARFLEVGIALIARGAEVRFALGPVEYERHPDWPRAIRKVAPIADCATLSALCGCLAGADVFIGNDSGPGHVAAALGIKTVTPFGPTEASIWRPIGSMSRFIQGAAPATVGWGIGVDAVLAAAWE